MTAINDDTIMVSGSRGGRIYHAAYHLERGYVVVYLSKQDSSWGTSIARKIARAHAPDDIKIGKRRWSHGANTEDQTIYLYAYGLEPNV